MRNTTKRSLVLLSCVAAGLLFVPARSFAQEKQDDASPAKKTITIHVTRDVNGVTTVIDTTVVTDGEFDADAFLAKKGVLKDIPADEQRMERRIIIRRPGEKDFNWSDSDGALPDTLKFGDDQEIVFSDKPDRPFPHFNDPGMKREFNFRIPGDFAPMRGPEPDHMLENMLRAYGLDDMMPMGDMKKAVVKKKRHGKKVIITFRDRDGRENGHDRRRQKEENIYYFNDDGQGMIEPGNQRVIIRKNHRNKSPEKTAKKLIIIEDQKSE